MIVVTKVFLYKMGLSVCVDLSALAAINLQETEMGI